MENQNEITTLEEFESNLKVLLETKLSIHKHNDENTTNSNYASLENQLKNADSTVDEITNDSTKSSNCTSPSTVYEEEKHLKTEYENDEVKMIKKNIIQYNSLIGIKLLHLLTGENQGACAWKYVLVDSNKNEMYLQKCSTGFVNAEDYGNILCCGWGENPPQFKINELNNLYKCINHNLFILKETFKKGSIYHYVLIKAEKQKSFDDQHVKGLINFENIKNYGRILHTGYGVDPPEVLLHQMERTYFFKDQLNLYKRKNLPIYLTIQNDDLEATIFYINNGFNLNEKNINDWTSLHYAAYIGNLQIVKYLLEHGADLHVSDSICGRKPVHIAAKEGHLDIIKLLLNSGNTVDDVDKKNWALLHYAAWNGHLEVVKFLFNEGANIHIADSFSSKKPIHIAAREGHTEIVELFLNYGMDIEDKDDNGCTCLYYTTWFKHLDTAEFLVSKSANINSENKFANSCIHVAVVNSVIDIVKLFLNNDADIDKPNVNGCTPLHFAVHIENIDIVILLIEVGANINAKSKDGKTPLDIAKKK